MTRLHEAHEWLVANCDIYEKANNRECLDPPGMMN